MILNALVERLKRLAALVTFGVALALAMYVVFDDQKRPDPPCCTDGPVGAGSRAA